MEPPDIGSQLRARRTAEGRTVASVAADAGLSVPYVANLENGRGNPTVTALGRLAEALGMRLEINLVQPDQSQGAGTSKTPQVPASLVRLGRTTRFRETVGEMATALGANADELSLSLVAALTAIAHALSREPAEADWWRLLDALFLLATHPAS
jgi:transcriptional regulator with XRE-family HTH domain